MSSEETAGAASGAAQGAAAGAVFGPWGAVIGAVVGGIAGALSGQKAKQAKKYASKAADVRRAQQTMQLAVTRRDTIRQQRVAAAQVAAAEGADSGVRSSATMGAQASVTSQGNSALNYFDAQVSADNLYQMYSKKAGKKAQQSSEIMSILGSASDLVTVGADAYGASKKPKGGGGYTSLGGGQAQNRDPQTSSSGLITYADTYNPSYTETPF